MTPDAFRARIIMATTPDELKKVEEDPNWSLALLEDPSLSNFLEENYLDVHLNCMWAKNQ